MGSQGLLVGVVTELEQKLRAIIQGVIDSDEDDIGTWAAEQLAALDGKTVPWKCAGPGGPWCETMTKRESYLQRHPHRSAAVRAGLRRPYDGYDLWDLGIVLGAEKCPCCGVEVNRPAL